MLDLSNYLDPTDPGFQDVIVGKHGGELGDPEDAFNWNTSLQHGRFTFGYQMRYLSQMYLNTYEDFNAVQDRRSGKCGLCRPARSIRHVFYHDIRLGVDVGPKIQFLPGRG